MVKEGARLNERRLKWKTMEGEKNSKEREGGASEWKSAGIWASAKQTSGEIAEVRK